MLAIIITALYGIISIVGGTIGYIKSGSVASIIAGGASGLVLLVCAYGMKKEKKIAFGIALLVAFVLGGRFLMTYLKTSRVMPDVIMIVFAGLTIISVVWSMVQKKEKD